MATPLRVLVVEDSEDDTALLMRMLRQGGYDLKCERVETPDGMRKALRDQVWDLIICDHNMPEFNSIAALKVLNESAMSMPFIIVSGTIGEEVAVAAMKAGAQDYIMKSNLKRLLPSIERELEEAKVRQARHRAETEVQQTYERLKRAMEGTVHAMAMMAEMKDPYTSGHQQRVTKLACAIARELKLTEERVRGLELAGLVHDIGKIAVPGEILSLPGRLTDVAFSIIKTHPQVSFNILKPIDFPWPIAEIALQHHERMNGSGYPQGLKGEGILLEARILAVADVIEAMACHRPYRAALGIEKALEEILSNRGRLFDAEVADACVLLFKEKGYKIE